MERFSKRDWKNLLKAFVQTNCVQIGAGFFFRVVMELVSKTDWKNLWMKFICISCIQFGAVIFFLAIMEVTKPDRKNLLKLSTNIGYIQIPVGCSFLLVTELISQIDWEEFLKTFISTSCIQVGVGIFFLVLIEIKLRTAQRNLLQIFIQTSCIQVGAGFLFLLGTELVSNTDWKKLLQTFISTSCVQIGAGFFFLVLTELASKTGSTWANCQILFLKWIKRSTEYMTELRMIADFIDDYHKGATIVNVAASSAGLASGILSIAGLITAPFAMDGSLLLVGVGATLGAAGGVVKVAAYFTDNVIVKSKQKRVNEIVGKYVKETKHLTNELVLINKAIHLTIDDKGMDLAKRVLINATWTLTNSIACISAVTSAVTRNTLGLFVAVSGILSALTVPWDLCSIVEEAREFHRGRRTEIAQMIRQIAQYIEDEVQYIENEISKCEIDDKELITFLSERKNNFIDLLRELFRNQ